MLLRRTLAVFALLAAVYGVLVMVAFTAPEDHPNAVQEAGIAVWVATVLVAHLFAKLGVPGLLEHGGACGWFPCAPSLAGWIFIAAFWTTAAGCVAWLLARLTVRGRREDDATR